MKQNIDNADSHTMSNLQPVAPAATAFAATVPFWSRAVSTKFRIPRLRRGLVPRAALLKHAVAMALEQRLTLVCAPAGFGKSTLLTQIAAHEGGLFEAVWLSLDEDDNDASQLFRSILGALHSVVLEWAVEPVALAGQVDGVGPGSRAAVAGLVNALCSYEGDRLLLVVDDLHRIADAAAMQLLDDIIHQLPPEVGLVIGSRAEPALSLALWRARGELGELRMADLKFNESDTQAFAAASGIEVMTPGFARDALVHADGWAAGLQLILGAAKAGGPTAAQPAGGHNARRHLFEFFAHEVLDGLPPELREFALQSSVLPELTPSLCQAVTGRDDARDLLDELYRRNLFLIALDETVPTLRFHDLFREFLGAELNRHAPQRVPELHARAALADTVIPRAVTHWLKARRWHEALTTMIQCVEPLLTQGSYPMVERWIEQLPTDVRQSRPEVAHLMGLGAWVQWDWLTARGHMERACEGYRAAGHTLAYVTALGVMGACHNSLGDLNAAARVLHEADALKLDATTRVRFDVLHAWHALATGHIEESVAWLQAAVDDIAQDPSRIYPGVIGLVLGHFSGLPNVLAPMRRLQTMCRQLFERDPTHGPAALITQGAWLEFWHGHRDTAAIALERQRIVQLRLPRAFAVMMSSSHLHAFHLAALGDHESALLAARSMLGLLHMPGAGGSKASWGRASLHVLARIHWMAQSLPDIQPLLPALLAERGTMEWPAYDMGRAMVRGQSALLAGDLEAAATALLEAVALHERMRLPAFMGDPRPSLALLQLRRGDLGAAWRSFAPVLDEALHDDCIGTLLLEPRAPLAQLLALIPPAEQDRPGLKPLLERLAQWHNPTRPHAASTSAAIDPGPSLSGREREVLALLASGLSNKLIARQLDLSPHTVKRHVANVLGKLAVQSRGQASAWFRAQAEH